MDERGRAFQIWKFSKQSIFLFSFERVINWFDWLIFLFLLYCFPDVLFILEIRNTSLIYFLNHKKRNPRVQDIISLPNKSLPGFTQKLETPFLKFFKIFQFFLLKTRKKNIMATTANTPMIFADWPVLGVSGARMSKRFATFNVDVLEKENRRAAIQCFRSVKNGFILKKTWCPGRKWIRNPHTFSFEILVAFRFII